jgi:hypothetical protein
MADDHHVVFQPVCRRDGIRPLRDDADDGRHPRRAAALRRSRGATGDTTYGFGSNVGFLYDFGFYSSAPSFTIYDTGGIDHLNASGYSDDQGST